MGYTVRFTPGAERDFKKISRDDARRIKEELVALSQESSPRTRIKKLKGSWDVPLYSFRISHYRLILSIEDQNLVIFVIEIGDRRNV
ncbi:MAG: type II toxin-antitoxin system RelE/ParE family toxin [Methanoregulaceae archaeon]|nr:type II toxin-antitoxin system RelE/ParE family toxin [Methanoregulaceae archaeon]